MSIEKHDLLHEFPEHKEAIHDLKVSNNHFARLFKEYHELDHKVRRMELGAEFETGGHLEQCKKQRLNLKDQLYKTIQEYSSARA